MGKSSHHREGHGREHITETPDVRHIQNPDVSHEESDVAVGPILKFVVGLLVFGIVVHLLIGVMFKYFNTREEHVERAEAPMSPMARSEQEKLPPEPRLQLAPGHEIHPLDEIKELRKEEQANLTNYSQPDPSTGTGVIPIKQAKEMLLQKGLLPSRPQPNGGPHWLQGMDVPAGSSSGRTTEKRDQ